MFKKQDSLVAFEVGLILTTAIIYGLERLGNFVFHLGVERLFVVSERTIVLIVSENFLMGLLAMLMIAVMVVGLWAMFMFAQSLGYSVINLFTKGE